MVNQFIIFINPYINILEKHEQRLQDDINIDVKLLNFLKKSEFKCFLEKNNI